MAGMCRAAVCRVCGTIQVVAPLRPVVDRVGKSVGLVYLMVAHTNESRRARCDGSDDYVAAHLVADVGWRSIGTR